ncbi:uncharacterized protein with beta-barrel porin domain [Pseudomonas sp. GGS8]|nr:uncharacterized protein with beta-barrel porin domain [Pseudomonas sp. GGS8]
MYRSPEVNERGEKGDTDGYQVAISGRLGYDIAPEASSPWHLSPFVSTDFAKVEVDGYSENSADGRESQPHQGPGIAGQL